MGLSLRPSTFSVGSLLDDVDAEVVRARFVSYDFEGKADAPKTCLLLVLKDGDGNEHPQYFSAGDPAFFVPSEDPGNPDLNGVTLVQVGDKQSLNGGTNAAIMLNSMVQAGFPEDKLDSGDARAIEGLVAHWNRVPQPRRSNMPSRPGQKEGPSMVLVVTSIKSLPGEAKAAKGKPAASGATTSKAAASATPPSNGTASAVSADLLSELGGEIIGLFASKSVSEMKKADISRGLFGVIEKTNPNKNKLISAAAKDEVLRALEGFTFNGSILKQE